APRLGLTLAQVHAGDARHVDHEARVDAVIAGRDALAAVAADLRPALGVGVAVAAGEQVDDALGDRHAVGRVEAGRLDHRAGLDAFAAARAGVDRRIDPRLHRFHKPAAAVRHHLLPVARQKGSAVQTLSPNRHSGFAAV